VTPPAIDPAALSTGPRSAAQARRLAHRAKPARAALLRQYPADPEGHFLAGLAATGPRPPGEAAGPSNRRSGSAPPATTPPSSWPSNTSSGRHADAVRLIEAYRARLGNSPMYLDLAGTIYSRLGLPERAAPLYRGGQPPATRGRAAAGEPRVLLGLSRPDRGGARFTATAGALSRSTSAITTSSPTCAAHRMTSHLEQMQAALRPPGIRRRGTFSCITQSARSSRTSSAGTRPSPTTSWPATQRQAPPATTWSRTWR
jgi:hypothetical protein